MEKSILTFDKSSFYLNGKPFRIIGGDIHYFRILPTDWGKRLDLAVDFGLNVVQTYVPWNAHEPTPGTYCFEGHLDLAAYLQACADRGLYVFLRPSPYICSEWDLGGLPAWLLRDRDMVIRSTDRTYMKAVRRYYEKLISVFRPYLATNGGPILAVAVENEYGSYGNEHAYIEEIGKLMRENGVDVPFYTADGDTTAHITFGRHMDDFVGVDYRATRGSSAHAKMVTEKMLNSPYFAAEFWAGRSMHWGEPFYHREPADTSDGFRELLELGGNVCFYMFSGGSNFGFMGGANYGQSYSPRPGTPIPRYVPHTTSYDVDALISEDGIPTEKYYLCRDELDRYMGRPVRPHDPPKRETQALQIKLAQAAPLFDNLDALTGRYSEGILPRPMEDYGQSYGMILYTQQLDGYEGESRPLAPENLRDRASIYTDGEYFATYMRDRGVKTAGAPVQNGKAMYTPKPEGTQIDVLVENLGRVNYGHEIPFERKGITALTFGIKLYGCKTRTLPLDDLSRLAWKENSETDFVANKPVFLRGEFDATAGADSYVHFAGFSHGYIWVNGFSLGRYDSCGPQMTLYLPGCLLKESGNVIEVLDVLPTQYNANIELLDHHILEGDAEELS